MEYNKYAEKILKEVRKAVVGKDEALFLTLSAMIAGGHVLIDDIPGVGKTTMANAFAEAAGLKFNRLQFTPDVLPSDILGFTVPNQEKHTMVFQKGAVFCHLLLADEINRTSPKTQSALLEVMEEYQVSIDGRTFPLEKPFIVLATQNPAGAAGTMMLPESETDRFMVSLSMGYPNASEEVEILKRKNMAEKVGAVSGPAELLAIQNDEKGVYIHDAVYDYIVRLVNATRTHAYIELGGSPRASLSLAEMSRASAYILGRDYVLPEDVYRVFVPVLNHRIVMNRQSRIDHVTKDRVLSEILKGVEKPAERKNR